MNPAIVFGIIFAVIWILSGVASWMNKQQEQERRRLLREQMAKVGVAVPPDSSRRTQQPRVAVPPRRAISKPKAVVGQVAQRAAAIARGLKPPVRPAGRRAPPVVAPLQTGPVAPTSTIESLVSPTKPSPSRNRADAPALSRWLRPATLRQQFILTEIFQPPLALRDSGRDS